MIPVKEINTGNNCVVVSKFERKFSEITELKTIYEKFVTGAWYYHNTEEIGINTGRSAGASTEKPIDESNGCNHSRATRKLIFNESTSHNSVKENIYYNMYR